MKKNNKELRALVKLMQRRPHYPEDFVHKPLDKRILQRISKDYAGPHLVVLAQWGEVFYLASKTLHKLASSYWKEYKAWLKIK